MAPLEEWDQEKVHWALEKKNLYGKSSYDRLNLEDSDHWDKLAAAVGIQVAVLAPTMGADFAEWLVRKTNQEEKWDKKEMYQGLTWVNNWGKAGLSHFAENRTWDEVA